MKYLIQNRKEFIITCGVFLTFIVIAFWSIWSIIHDTFTVENMLAIIGGIIEYFGWYFNMPTSEENSRYTGKMRLEKAMKNSEEFIGEDFFNEPDENEGEES